MSSLGLHAGEEESSPVTKVPLLQQVKALREAGKEPYGYSFARTHKAADLQQEFRDVPNGQNAEIKPRSIAVAGMAAVLAIWPHTRH